MSSFTRHGKQFKNSRLKNSSFKRQGKQLKNSLPWLPQELILKILEELPLKSICKFRTVSKSWNQLLSSPSFIPSSLSFPKTFFLFENSSLSSPKTFLNFFPFKRNCEEDRLFYAADIEYNKASICKETTFQHRSIGISCCSNGLLCFLSQPEKTIFIGNPLTQKEFVSIPTPNTQVDDYTMAFSFDPISRNIIIIAFEWNLVDHKKHSLWIYDSAIQNWRSLDVGLPIYDRSSSHPFCTSHCIIGTTWYALCHQSVVCYDMKKKAWEKIDSPLSLELELMDLNAWWYSQLLEWNGRLSCVITSGIGLDGIGSLKAGVWVFSWEEKKWVQVLRADLKEWGLTERYRHIGFYDDIFFLVAYNKCVTYDMKSRQLKRFESDESEGCFLPMPFRPTLLSWKPNYQISHQIAEKRNFDSLSKINTLILYNQE
ncbi:hypothetical protein AMTRI_Chr07g79660 [Amborella trichopoda]|uniref:putative F-box protein At3g10240 n=1 Tax=Amborella trichopoda TaxID=13333 RepID=UPI0009BE74D4|nr:putative F-box protein At3g10240 [Amborella trichopoda]|eukprot:XP_020522131.1 putative F-box protein At3g10240 [Amborella trichopoda]